MALFKAVLNNIMANLFFKLLRAKDLCPIHFNRVSKHYARKLTNLPAVLTYFWTRDGVSRTKISLTCGPFPLLSFFSAFHHALLLISWTAKLYGRGQRGLRCAQLLSFLGPGIVAGPAPPLYLNNAS